MSAGLSSRSLVSIASAMLSLACGGGPRRPPLVYACEDGVAALAHDGTNALVVAGRRIERTSRTGDGDHFETTRDGVELEYVVPRDPREDALVWSNNRTDRALRERCSALGGHVDLLSRWIRGDSVDEIAAAYGIPVDDTHQLLRESSHWLLRRVSRGRIVPEAILANASHAASVP